MNQDLRELDPRLHPAPRADRRLGRHLPSGEKNPAILQLISHLLNAWGYSSLLTAINRSGPPGTDKSFSPSRTRPARKKEYRILIIEDDFASLQLYSLLLGAFGYTTLVAVDGEEGLALARSDHPDLILCDIKLPKLDGVEVVRQLKSDTALAKIPVIAVTAYAMFGDRERLLMAGFDDYIPKPIEAEGFIDHVRDLIADKGRGRPD